MLGKEQCVDCGCDPRLFRLLPQPVSRGLDVAGCLGCGRVCVTEQIIEEPHPHMVMTVGREIVSVPGEALAWLGRWPRLAKSSEGGRWVLLAASLRCDDPEALDAMEREAGVAQAGRTLRARLVAAGAPLDACASLPERLECFAQMRDGLAAWPIGGRDAVALFGRSMGAREVLLHELRDDPGFRAALEAGLDDEELWAASYSLIQIVRFVTPGITATLARRVAGAQTLREVVVPVRLAKWIGARSPELEQAARDAMARVGAEDDYLRKELAEYLRLLR